MPPKTSRIVLSGGSIERLRQSIAQRYAATAPEGAPDHEAALPPLELQAITAPAPSTQQSSATSTSTTRRSFPRSIHCKNACGGDYIFSTFFSLSSTKTVYIYIYVY